MSPTPSPYSIYLGYLAQGILAYQHSRLTGHAVFYPRAVSPHGVDDSLEWRASAGVGTVYSSTVVSPRGQPPYNVALVDCDEGFRLMTRVEECAPEEVRIGMRVKFRTHTPDDPEGDPYPVFTPVSR